jgi:threonine-phosphate decarboxylase
MRKIPPPYTDPSYLFRHGGTAPPGVLDFSAGINPLGPPASVLEAICKALPDIARYPDPACRELTAQLAERHGVAPEQIVVGNGSNELIYAIARAFRPKRVAIAEPTYTEYLRASLVVGAEVDHWLADGDHFKREFFDTGKAELVWFCNPNNPTGHLSGASSIARWVQSHSRSIFIVDEAFEPLCLRSSMSGRGLPTTLLSLHAHLPNLIVLRSMTKYYALPGLRLGYAVTTTEIADRLRAEQPPWSVNSLAQVAGLAALADEEFYSQTRDCLLPEASFLTRLKVGGVRFLPLRSSANFVLVRLQGISSRELCDRLAERGISVRDASNFVGLDEHYVRIAVQTRPDNERLLTELRVIFES